MEKQTCEQLHEWTEQIASIQMIEWDQFPELDLYMDQVITIMNRQLQGMNVESDRPLTPSMINNYVKDEVMPRPNQKKYTRDHLTVLSLICMLKSEFTLPQIRELVGALSRFYSPEEVYAAFCHAQVTHLREAAKQVETAESMDEAARYQLAMDLALEANAKRIAAAKLLSSLTPTPDDGAVKKEKKDKKEKKKKKDTQDDLSA